jgi:hypothetical protein
MDFWSRQKSSSLGLSGASVLNLAPDVSPEADVYAGRGE